MMMMKMMMYDGWWKVLDYDDGLMDGRWRVMMYKENDDEEDDDVDDDKGGITVLQM